jgi:hypothetical protein
MRFDKAFTKLWQDEDSRETLRDRYHEHVGQNHCHCEECCRKFFSNPRWSRTLRDMVGEPVVYGTTVRVKSRCGRLKATMCIVGNRTLNVNFQSTPGGYRGKNAIAEKKIGDVIYRLMSVSHPAFEGGTTLYITGTERSGDKQTAAITYGNRETAVQAIKAFGSMIEGLDSRE